MKVCVIGAGPAGLCAIKHLNQNGFSVVCFEKQTGPGGLWRYTEKNGSENKGVNVDSTIIPISPIHRDMKSNTPHPFWNFEDFDFDTSLPEDRSSFPYHSRVLEYIQAYCKHFGMDEFIRYNTLVEKVTPTDPSTPSTTGWLITTKDLTSQETSTTRFDVVMFATGRFWYPYVPKDIPGLAEFTGRLLHTADFDSADDFAPDERVLVVGSSISGLEVVEVLSNRCKEVIWSHHAFFINADNAEKLFPSNVKHVSDIECIKEGSLVHFKPGAWNSPTTPEKIDTIILGTGFLVDDVRNMLDPSVNLEIDRGTFQPLHRQVVHMDFHTLCFPFQFDYEPSPAKLVDHIMKYYIRWLQGKFQLPSRSEMEKIREQELAIIEKVIGSRDQKFLRYMFMPGETTRITDFLNGLSDEAGMDRVEQIYQDNTNDYFAHIFSNPMTYKNYIYEVQKNGQFKIRKPEH